MNRVQAKVTVFISFNVKEMNMVAASVLCFPVIGRLLTDRTARQPQRQIHVRPADVVTRFAITFLSDLAVVFKTKNAIYSNQKSFFK